MNLAKLLKTLDANYRLDFVLIETTKDMIVESGITDYDMLLKSILSSQKYDYLAKVSDGIAKNSNASKVSQNQLEAISSFSDKLHKKVCDIFDKINWEIQSQGRDLNKYKLDKMFSEKELQVLVRIGKRNRLLNLVTHHKSELLDLIYEAVRDLTIEKNKPATGIENKNPDVIKMLENGER